MTTELWTIQKVLTWTASKFADKGISSARLDAEVLLAHALGLSRIGLYTGFERPLGPDELTRFREMVRRRLAGEPVAYIVGEQEFWSMPLTVSSSVLVPRRDTETLVEVALQVLRAGDAPKAPRIVDVGVGSGAVALALAKEFPSAEVVAVDASAAALAVAKQNAARHGLDERVRFLEGDLLTPTEGDFDLVVSNPPYIPTAELATLSAEVRCEPRGALDGGPDGLDLVRPLVEQAAPRLRPGAWLALEHAWDQGERVRALLVAAGLVDVATRQDLAENDRVTFGRRPPTDRR